ncbi:MAG TPA: phosphoglycerate kinase [Candidatus Wolfebacteria bacterium]|nr:phosphoglycerate kinase [Candidatus Wolfebacteria bacterium]
MKFLTLLKNKNLSNKTCILRVDFNISLTNTDHTQTNTENFRISPRSVSVNPRISGVLSTIKFLTSRGAKVVILSHRGRPLTNLKTKKLKDPKLFKKEFSLKFAADFLNKKLKKKITFVNNFNFAAIKRKIDKSPIGSIFLLENLRFLPGEKKNDVKLAKKLASLGDFYVNDAFGVCHRNNASVVGITRFIPSYAGLLLESEIKNLNKLNKNPRKPLVVIIGGIKISDKIGLIKNFQKKTDYFLTGGGISNTMVAAEGLPIGDSLYEPKMLLFAKQLLKSCSKKIILPDDVIVDKRRILDIGPQTIEKYKKIIKKAKTIIWNGPLGNIEDPKFLNGSKEIAKAILESNAFSVIGGGETVGLLKAKNSKPKKNIFISTGGGAMLEYLAGKKLPGIVALEKKGEPRPRHCLGGKR